MLGHPGEGMGSVLVVFTSKLSQVQLKVLEAGAGRNLSAIDRKGIWTNANPSGGSVRTVGF